MTTEFKSITDKLLNNTDENKQFMQLGDFHTENKKWVSTLIFDTEDGKLRLQLPPCSTKAGIIDMTNKTYTDLLFDNSTDEIKELVNLFLTLENIAAKELHSKSDSLFEECAKNMTLDDFEEMFTSTFRLLKIKQMYVLGLIFLQIARVLNKVIVAFLNVMFTIKKEKHGIFLILRKIQKYYL